MVRPLLDQELVGRLPHTDRSAVAQLIREIDAEDVFGAQCLHELASAIGSVERICREGTTRITVATEYDDEYEEEHRSADAAVLEPRLLELTLLRDRIHAVVDLVRAELELETLYSRSRGAAIAAPRRARRP